MRRLALALLFLSASSVTMIGCAPFPTSPGYETQPDQVAKRETAEALSKYVVLVRRQDSTLIADLFAVGGRMQHAGEKPIQGRAEIKRFLDSFSNYKVLSHDMTVLSVSPAATHVSQSGTYVQLVKTPEGNSVTVRGWFVVQWLRQAPGVWLIELAKTSSSPMGSAGDSGA